MLRLFYEISFHKASIKTILSENMTHVMTKHYRYLGNRTSKRRYIPLKDT